jgi:hypothetical protein
MVLRARYYDPSTGEFTSPDPLEYVDGMSLYRGYMGLIRQDIFGTTVLAGCGIGAAWSGGTSIVIDVFNGNVFNDFGGTCCRATGAAIQGCIVGGVVGAIGPGAGTAGGFGIGCLAGILGKFIGDAVRHQLGCGDQVGWCDLLQATVACITGGAGGGFKGGGGQMDQWTSRLLGIDIAIWSRNCRDGIPVPPINNKACCTFKTYFGSFVEENVPCPIGKTSLECCASRADGWFNNWELLGVLDGACP